MGIGDFDCCYNCSKRKAACHGSCKEYKIAKEKYNKKLEIEKENKKKEQDLRW